MVTWFIFIYIIGYIYIKFFIFILRYIMVTLYLEYKYNMVTLYFIT